MLSTRLIRSIADGPQTRAIHAVLEGAELGGVPWGTEVDTGVRVHGVHLTLLKE